MGNLCSSGQNTTQQTKQTAQPTHQTLKRQGKEPLDWGLGLQSRQNKKLN